MRPASPVPADTRHEVGPPAAPFPALQAKKAAAVKEPPAEPLIDGNEQSPGPNPSDGDSEPDSRHPGDGQHAGLRWRAEPVDDDVAVDAHQRNQCAA